MSGEGTYDGSVMWLNEKRFSEAYKDTLNDISFNKTMPSIGAVAEVFDGTIPSLMSKKDVSNQILIMYFVTIRLQRRKSTSSLRFYCSKSSSGMG